MSRREFYREWWRRAGEGAWGTGRKISFALSILLGFVVYVRPGIADQLTPLLWAVSLAVFVATLIVGLARAPYGIYKELGAERDQLRAQADDKERRKKVRDALGLLLLEANRVFEKRIENDAELGIWKKDLDQWITKTRDTIQTMLSLADAAVFSSVSGALNMEYQHRYNAEHNSMLILLNKHRENLLLLMNRV